ncbi:uncharacterized protein LOC127001629 isoform X2 [Eriocheir sinensis]|uniref:uncharacterized protein LOC127001629 isoform X2 n=1 Tax=Eriocheir sinensis TaxID=95602 RepID=UPI0021C774AE|nr:uncharacterized protein LOC127001629 isoform X2 [Eriocheir sinensis]
MMAVIRDLLQACLMAATVAAVVAMAAVEPVNGGPEEGEESALAQRVAVLEAVVARLVAAEEDGGLGQLERSVAALENDITMLALLDSRIRAMESEQRLLSRDVTSMGRGVRQQEQEVEAVKRQVRQLEASAEREEEPTCCRPLNESILRAEERGRGVNASLSDLRRHLHNLSHDLQDLQQQTRHLLLCPAPYVKMGGECFHLLEGKWAWDEARVQCQELGANVGGHGDLATPADVAAFRVYVEALEAGSKFLWVGGVREDGRWRWVSEASREEKEEEEEEEEDQEEGSPLGLPWDIGEPDNFPDQQYLCIHSVGSIKFHDCLNSAYIPAVCQVI